MTDANFIENIYIGACEFNGRMGFAFVKENGDFQAGSFNYGSEERAFMWALYYGLKSLNPMLQTNLVIPKDKIYKDFLDLKSEGEKFFNTKSTTHMDIWRDIDQMIRLRQDSVKATYDFDTGKDMLLKAKRYAEKAAGRL